MAFPRDPIGYIEALARKYPGVARISMLGLTHIYLWDPEAIGDLLVDRQGLFWRRQRSLVAPALSCRHLDVYAEIATSRTSEYIARIPDGDVRDIKVDMTRLTMEIVTPPTSPTILDQKRDRISRPATASACDCQRTAGC